MNEGRHGPFQESTTNLESSSRLQRRTPPFVSSATAAGEACCPAAAAAAEAFRSMVTVLSCSAAARVDAMAGWVRPLTTLTGIPVVDMFDMFAVVKMTLAALVNEVVAPGTADTTTTLGVALAARLACSMMMSPTAGGEGFVCGEGSWSKRE